MDHISAIFVLTMEESPLPSLDGIAAVRFGHNTGMLVFLGENLLSAVSHRSPQKFRQYCFPKSFIALNAPAWPEPTQSSHTHTHTHTTTHFVLALAIRDRRQESKSVTRPHSQFNTQSWPLQTLQTVPESLHHVAGLINKHSCIRANTQRMV